MRPTFSAVQQALRSGNNRGGAEGASGSSSGGLSVAGILAFMGSYPDPIASQGEIYFHRLAEAYDHVFAVTHHNT